MKIILQTERLLLRELHTNDYQDLCEILQDQETMFAFEHAFSDDEVNEWLDRQLCRYQSEGHGLWAVLHQQSNEFLGVCGITIQTINKKQYLEIGYLFKKKQWHKGYATEAAIGCRQYAFETLKADKIYSIIRNSNAPSQNVAKRLDMKKVDEITKHYYGMDMLHYVFEVALTPESAKTPKNFH